MMIDESDEQKLMFDVAVTNNVGSKIKTKESWIWLATEDGDITAAIEDKLAMEFGWEGIGEYEIYDHNPMLNVGDQMPLGIAPLRTVSIMVSSLCSAAVITSEEDGYKWVSVAAPGQTGALTLGSTQIPFEITEDALKSNLDMWEGAHINVNHVDGTQIKDFKISAAKYEDENLHVKVTDQIAEFLLSPATSGTSIEVKPLKLDSSGNVLEIKPLGLSALYPPLKPACSKEMGCDTDINKISSSKSNLLNSTFNKLAGKVKSHSFHTNEASGIHNPTEDKNMSTEIETLTSARIEAESKLGEALKENVTLTSSLSDKESLIAEQTTTLEARDATIVEQADALKVFKDAEVVAAEELKETQWTTIASSLAPGLTHKKEDADALKAEFMKDPAGFSVKLSSMKLVSSTAESGSQHTTENVSGKTTGVYTPGKGYGE